jgi:hypothetical protein
VSIPVLCIWPEYIGLSISVLCEDVNGCMRFSFRVPAPKAGVNGVKGVLGVEM